MNLPANPLLQLVPARIPQAVHRVRSMVWTTIAPVSDISATTPSPEHLTYQEGIRQRLHPVRHLPVYYGKLWDQRWFRLRLPRTSARSGVFLHWQDQAEATLHINGIPHYGFDVAHPRALLPPGTREVWIESVVAHTGIWHPDSKGLDPEGSRLTGAVLQQRNDQAWEVLHDFLVLEDLMQDEIRNAFPAREGEFGSIGTKPTLGVIPPLLRRVLRFLDDAVNALDGGGLTEAHRVLRRAFAALSGHNHVPSALLTGHAHIDLVWLWPERVGEFKALHTFATANRLMDQYPDFHFAYSQPASYEAVRRISPAADRAVRRRMREGRWEAHGATYVESDTLLACGEALARSFLVGQDGFQSLTGRPSPILWLPDVFGYSGCLPQLALESGASFFFTTKLTWNAITAFPHSSFVWAGSDGSEIIAHICQNNGYNQNAYVGELRRGAAAHRQCDVHPEYLAPTGFGDGGGGVTEEMCERVRRCANLAGVPRATWGRLDGFFSRLGAIQNKLPVYRGELYFEYHRGTYTTHGEIKGAMRRAERALQVLEAAHCAGGRGAIDEYLWKRVIFAQFHDYIPGSSIHEVYAEAKTELDGIARKSGEMVRQMLPRGATPALFNGLPYPRVVRTGRTLRTLPPLAGAPIAALPSLPAPKITASAQALADNRVSARFDLNGRLRSLSVDGHQIPFTAGANELWLYPEHPHAYDAWDIDRQALSIGHADTRPARIQMADESVAFTRPLGRKSSITIRYQLVPGSPVLRITYDLDWREEHMLLKAVFPTSFMGRDARYGAPFGSVRRSQSGGPPAAEAMWEVPASRWAVVADDNESEGFFMVTEAKYGFSCRDGSLGLSLVRSARITREDRGQAPGSHPEPIRRTLAPQLVSDIGSHRIEVAVGRFLPQAPRAEHPAALAETLFSPPIAYNGPGFDCGFIGLEGGDSLQPVWARPGGHGCWTLRLHETLGRSGACRLQLAPGWTARRVDLRGNPVKGSKSIRRLAFKPYQVVSVEIKRVR